MKSKDKRGNIYESPPNSVGNPHTVPVNMRGDSTDAAGGRLLMFFEKMGKVVVIFLAGIVLCFLSAAGFFEKAFIGQNLGEHCVFLKHSVLFGPAILLGVLLLLFARNIIYRINSRTLFLALSSLYLVAGMYLIFNADPNIRSDANSVYQGARALNQGEFWPLEGGRYFAFYPYQLGLATYERIFMLFSPNVKFFFTLNLLMVLIINCMQWKISEILSGNNAQAVNYTIIISFAFLPQLFFVLFLYGLIPGLCCSIAAVYFMIRYFQERRLKDCVFSMVLIAVGCTLRNNYMIAAIAMLFLYLLDFFRSGRKRSLLIAFVTVVCAVMLPKGVNTWYRYESGIDFGAGIPKLLWVTMGLQDSPRMSGWYNGYVAYVIDGFGMDYELAQKKGLEDLQERVNYFRENPGEAALFFENKVKSTWLDPLFQSTWSGPLEDADQHMQTQLLSDLYNGEGVYGLLSKAMNFLLVIIYLMSLLYLIFAALTKKACLTCEKLFPYIFFLGGFFFHLMWETKSQYVYPYVFMLIPMSALGIDLVGACLIRYLKEIKKRMTGEIMQ